MILQKESRREHLNLTLTLTLAKPNPNPQYSTSSYPSCKCYIFDSKMYSIVHIDVGYWSHVEMEPG